MSMGRREPEALISWTAISLSMPCINSIGAAWVW